MKSGDSTPAGFDGDAASRHQHVGVGEQPTEVRRFISRAPQPHDVDLAVGVAELDHAQGIAAEPQAHGFRVDRQGGRAGKRPGGKVAFVDMRGCGYV